MIDDFSRRNVHSYNWRIFKSAPQLLTVYHFTCCNKMMDSRLQKSQYYMQTHECHWHCKCTPINCYYKLNFKVITGVNLAAQAFTNIATWSIYEQNYFSLPLATVTSRNGYVSFPLVKSLCIHFSYSFFYLLQPSHHLFTNVIFYSIPFCLSHSYLGTITLQHGSWIVKQCIKMATERHGLYLNYPQHSNADYWINRTEQTTVSNYCED